METILLVIHVILALSLVGIILIQRSSADGLGLSSASSNGMDSFLSGRATANLLTHTTAILAALFMINSLVLAFLATNRTKDESIIEKVIEQQDKQNHDSQVVPAKPEEPIVPLAE